MIINYYSVVPLLLHFCENQINVSVFMHLTSSVSFSTTFILDLYLFRQDQIEQEISPRSFKPGRGWSLPKTILKRRCQIIHPSKDIHRLCKWCIIVIFLYIIQRSRSSECVEAWIGWGAVSESAMQCINIVSEDASLQNVNTFTSGIC